MRQLTPYDWFWVGKSEKSRKGTEELIQTLKLKFTTHEDIAKKYNLSPTALKENVSKLLELGLIDLPIVKYNSSNICVVCNKNQATQEHHLNYNPEVKINVCDFCHNLIHSKGKAIGRKGGGKKNAPFLVALPFIILDENNNRIGNRKYNSYKYYMRLLREWKKSKNPDEIKTLALNFGLQIKSRNNI